MAKELPFFRFTVSEWLNDDISLEDYKTQGVFASVCAFYWFQDCSITQAKLKKRFSDAIPEIEALLKLGILKEDSDGFISIKFLDEQYDILSEKRKNRVEAGRKGGKARASNAQAMLKQSSSYKYKDKYNYNYKDKEYSDTSVEDDTPPVKRVNVSDESLSIAKYLHESICKFDASHRYNRKKPNLTSWAVDIDKAIRIDGRTQEQLKFIIEFLFTQKNSVASFWSANIQSGKKLREKFDVIKNQIKTEKSKTENNHGNYKTKGDLHVDFLNRA